MGETEVDIVKRMAEGQIKYAYFLLAVAMAAIAFAVQQTVGRAFEWPMVALAFAFCSWVCSFVAGCKNRTWDLKALDAYRQHTRVCAGTHERTGTIPPLIQEGARTCRHQSPESPHTVPAPAL